MQTVAEVLRDRLPAVHTVAPEATVLEAVGAMRAARVRAVLVCEDGWPGGIVSQGDVLTRVILAGRDPASSIVSEVMTRDVAYIHRETSTDEAMALMTKRGCGHLPVVEGHAVVGMVSIGDLMGWASREQRLELQALLDYVRGVA
jgi:CBS domain-containing protein